MQIIVAELEAVAERNPGEGDGAVRVRGDFLENLARQPHGASRCFLVGGPLRREDGGELDVLLKQFAYLKHAAQEQGARIEGAVLLNAGADRTAACAAALEGLCARLQTDAVHLQVLCASDEMAQAARDMGIRRIDEALGPHGQSAG